MKINRFLAHAGSNEKCTYQVSVPLQFNKDLNPSEKENYHIEIIHKGKALDAKKQNDSYTFERTDKQGKYAFSIQLKKENNIIEEQQIEVHIKEDYNIEIDLGESPQVEIDDSSLFETARDIITKMELKVGRKAVRWGMGSFPVAEDKDSEIVFKNLKSLKKDDEIIQIICKIISDEKEDGLIIWKSVTVLKYFKSIHPINYTKDLAKRDFKDENVTKYLHESCIKYLESVNFMSNRNLVANHLSYFALECITPEARSSAVSILVKNGKRNDEKLIQFLFKVINEDTSSKTKLAALGGLTNFNITYHQEEIEELLQDASPNIRTKTSTVLLKNPLKLNFDLLTEIFEQETDKSARKSLCDLLYKNYSEMAIPYFLRVIDMEDEDFTSTILDTTKYGKDVEPIVEKLTNIKDSNAYSVNLNKKIEDFLKRHSKNSQG